MGDFPDHQRPVGPALVNHSGVCGSQSMQMLSTALVKSRGIFRRIVLAAYTGLNLNLESEN
jgi:hypothetical protein